MKLENDVTHKKNLFLKKGSHFKNDILNPKTWVPFDREF